MANNSAILQLILTARDNASAVFRSVFNALNDGTNVIAGKVRDAFSGMFGGGLDAAIEMEAQLDRVASKGGYTAEEMKTLKDAAETMGVQFGVSGLDAAKGMESLAAAGLNATETIKALPPVLALAASEQINVDDAAQKLIDSLSIMGLGFENAAMMADVLAKAANITTSSSSQLAEALSQAGGTGRAAGMDLQYVVAALDLLHKNGIKGSEAGTAFKGMVTSLIDPASSASKELNNLGISTRDLGEVLAALKEKGGKAEAAILAFGTEAGPGLRALLSEGKESLDNVRGQLTGIDEVAIDTAKTMGGNLKTALASLNSAWETLQATLLEPLLEPLTKSAKAMTQAFQDAAKDGSIKSLQTLLQDFGTRASESIIKAVKSFDFAAASKSVQDFAINAMGSFELVVSSAKAAAGVIQIGFNAITAPIKAVIAGIATQVSWLFELLATIEKQSAKLGVGTLEHAEGLMRKAEAAKATAKELLDGVLKDVEDIGDGANKVGTAFDGVLGSMKKAREEAEKARPPDFGDATTLTPIQKGLEDYEAILKKAVDAQAAAKKEADDAAKKMREVSIQYSQGTVNIQKYEEAVNEDATAQERLKKAVANVIDSQRDLDTAKKAGIDTSKRNVIQGDSEKQQKEQMAQLSQLLVAAGLSELEVKRMQALMAGNMTEVLKIENELRKQQLELMNASVQKSTDAGNAQVSAEQAVMDKEKEHEEQTKAAGDIFSAIINGWQTRLSSLSDAAGKAFKSIETGLGNAINPTYEFVDGLSEAENGLRKVENDINQMQKMFMNASGFSKWANALAEKSLAVEQAFYSQAVQAEKLTEKLNAGGRGLQQLVVEAENAKSRFGLLDEERLENLQSAIDAAKDKMREMKEETQSAKERLMEMNAELLELQGQDEKSKKLKEQLDYEQQLAEIERQRVKAELEGNRELIATLDEQRRILEQIHQQKLTNIKTESDAAKKEENNTKTSSSKTSSSNSGGTTTSGGTTNNVVNNFYIDPTKLASEEWVRKNVLPTINRVQNWTR